MRIVTGMHRSGTSFVANILHTLGMPLDSRVIPTDCWNEAGYFENLELVLLNDRLILGDWFGLANYRKTPSGSRPLWLVALVSILKARYAFFRSTTAIAQRADLLQEEIKRFAAHEQNFLFKDPRFSLTLQGWRQHADISEVLYSFRHPLEVAQSLKKRERIPLWLGLRVWLFHVESFLRQAENLSVTYINFNNFFDEGLCMEEIRRCFSFARRGYSHQEANAILQGCLRRDLKKNVFVDGDSVPACYLKLYRNLLELHG